MSKTENKVTRHPNADRQISKFLSLILRHRPESVGIYPDTQGWVDVQALLDALARTNHPINRTYLEHLVATSDKKRFAFSADGTKIRANQGHSFAVDLGLQPAKPPRRLYHGTSERFLPDILTQGLTKQQRHHVHLSADIVTARKVGSRHPGKLALLAVDTEAMQCAGLYFYVSDNGVWLTDHVPNIYLTVLAS